MKIPKQVKIGGHIISIREIEMVDDVACSGDASYVNGEIRLNKNLPQTQKEASLIHEMLHFCNTTLNHELLDSLSEQLYQVLKDNDFIK